MGVWSALTALLGGVGLFLLGMWLMTDGLRRGAGGMLREILASWTGTTGRAIFAGFGLTAVVQSSSAVTVAAVGFVNAELLSLQQAVGVIYGANIGTTVTGWVVALTGVQVKLDAYALPLIGVGMLLRLSGSTTRRGAYGQALAGFALFLLGVQALKVNFGGLAEQMDFAALPASGWQAMLLYFGIGVVLTMLIQSSSATTAITIAAAASGIVPAPLAALVVIGADVGTSSSAVVAAIGATANARRAAACHVLFNLVTAAVGLALLVPLLAFAVFAQDLVGLPGNPGVTLAIFSTSFNVLGVLAMLPFTGAMARFLEGRFVSQQEGLARPRHLDDNLLQVPSMALQGVGLEVRRLGTLTLELAADSCGRSRDSMGTLARTDAALNALAERIQNFVGRLDLSMLPREASATVVPLLRAIQHYGEVSDLAVGGGVPSHALPDPFAGAMAEVVEATRGVLERSDTARALETEELRAAQDALEGRYESMKAELLQAAASGSLSVGSLDAHVQEISRLHRMAERAAKAAGRLSF